MNTSITFTNIISTPAQPFEIQRLQNWVLRLITDAPWYDRNGTLPKNLNMTDTVTTIDITFTKLHLTMIAKPLLQEVTKNLPQPIGTRRSKRKNYLDNLGPTG